MWQGSLLVLVGMSFRTLQPILPGTKMNILHADTGGSATGEDAALAHQNAVVERVITLIRLP